MSTSAFSFGQFVWWVGTIEDVNDVDLKAGRVKVRIRGFHSDKKSEMPTENLMWASVLMPTISASVSGVGFSPSGLVPGSEVMGFFLDGFDAQIPVVMGSIAGIPKAQGDFEFPRYVDEPDTNRLARAERLSETVLQKKKDSIDTAKKAFGGEWKEPSPPYAAEYPNNKVFESPSGHIKEIDDTPAAERLHEYHKSGTFTEIHPKGDLVTKVVKDKYEITMGDEYVHIKGKCFINIIGDANVLIEGNCDMEINGNKRETVHGNSMLKIDGNYTVEVAGVHKDTSGTHRIINAPRVDIN